MTRPVALWAAVWLAAISAAAKVAVFGFHDLREGAPLRWARDVAAAAHEDLIFAAAFGAAGAIALLAARGHRAARASLVAAGALLALYAVLAAIAFTYVRAPLTVPLFALATDVRILRSSAAFELRPGSVAALVLAPIAYAALVVASSRRETSPRAAWIARALALAAVLGVTVAGRDALAVRWRDRADRRLAESPHAVLLASAIEEWRGGGGARLPSEFPAEMLEDFRPRAGGGGAAIAPRPRNVILLVLESVGARYLSLYGSPYDTTPNLAREAAAHGLTFDRFHAHAGMSSKSLVATLLSRYPPISWREPTLAHPRCPGTSLAEVLRARGYRTGYLESGDGAWAGIERFLENRGFDDFIDWPDLPNVRQQTSWGAEDRFLVDGLLEWIDRDRTRPFFAMAWTVQAHHPYEPSPDRPFIDFFAGRPEPPDAWDLGRYLNVLRATDAEIGRLFDGLRARGLADDTLVVVTGDHGEAFGDPHDTWGHGFALYQEDVHVPLVLWNPRLFAGERTPTIGGHVDLAPTIAAILGVPRPEGPRAWEGRSLFEPGRPPRVYFFMAKLEWALGVREGDRKYVYNATTGRETLFDLARDPEEREDLSASDPETCRRLRQRLAAWVAHVRDGGAGD